MRTTVKYKQCERVPSQRKDQELTLKQAMTDKNAAALDQVSKLQISSAGRNEVVTAGLRIQVLGDNPAEASQAVNDSFPGEDVVVQNDRPAPAIDERDARHSVASLADDHLRPGLSKGRLLLLEGNKLCVKGNHIASPG